MTTSPVSEAEMNNFFDGIEQFKHRMANGIVAYSEQAKRIDELTAIVERLQNSVDALTATVKQLTEDRNEARRERDAAISDCKAAVAMAEESERKYNELTRLFAEAQDTVSTLQYVKGNNEETIATIRGMNEEQERTLKQAFSDNERLQDRLRELIDERDEVRRVNGELHEKVRLAHIENRKFHNVLEGVRAVLNEMSPAPSYPHVVNG